VRERRKLPGPRSLTTAAQPLIEGANHEDADTAGACVTRCWASLLKIEPLSSLKGRRMRTNSLSSRPVSLGVIFAIAFTFALAPSVAHAQTQYSFTKIADTVSDPEASLDGILCLGLSNSGTVVINSSPGVWLGDGTAGLSSVAAAANSGNCPSINDLDEITHLVLDPATGVTTLVKNNNGTLTPLASSSASPYLSGGTTYLASLSLSGSAVYQANGVPGPGTGAGIYVGPGGIKVIDNTSDPQIQSYSTASMNDSLVVAFRAFNTASSQWGIYRGSAVPLVEEGGSVITNVFLNRPVINNSGMVAFVGRDVSDNVGVFTTNDGVNFAFVGAGASGTSHNNISINNNGAVAWTLLAGLDATIVVSGPGPASPVISSGDALDGLIVQNLFIWEEALNDNGQVAFWAFLGDCATGGCPTTRIGVYRADPNRPPVASDGTASVTAGASVSGTLSATDPDGDSITYSIVTTGTKGTAQVTNSGTGAYTYTANAGSSGADTFTFRANDGVDDSNVATITIAIAANRAPVASNRTVTTPEDRSVSGRLSASDLDGDPLTFTVVSNGTRGTATITNASTGRFSYVPAPNATGTDVFTFQASDGAASSNIATVTVTITPQNDPPVANDGSYTTVANQPVSGTLVVADVDGDPLTSSVSRAPRRGTVVVTNAATGMFTYTPNAGYVGTDRFTFRVTDPSGAFATATVTVTVQ